ncbi:hypothetical protein JR316_0006117 [Psilocybe cubensis]|uniref:Uncharacterized protein n=2 Tax=Psilocybe cubensis TaxID=181762 RepID=A0A8H8CMT9_PSICU|nr:hypothetical protein JR316_0006117 [Psilocybe cubensis]KAH9481590.1 hypothetical protein JR316_0006117 [Psilocybe cubensis]
MLVPIPIIGNIVRYRATYYPKSTLDQVDAEVALPPTSAAVDVPLDSTVKSKDPTVLKGTAGAEPVVPDSAVVTEPLLIDGTPYGELVPELTGPPTLLGVAKNVWNREHISGTFRGIFPGLFFPFIFFRLYVTPGPCVYLVSYYEAIIKNLFYIPYLILTYRIIVCQQKLNFGKPKSVFRTIFSEYERAHPFRAIRHSPFILPFLCLLCIDLLLLPLLRTPFYNLGDLTAEGFDPTDEKYQGQPWTALVQELLKNVMWGTIARMVAYPLLMGAVAVVMAPVDVVLTRLAIQPVHEPIEQERESEKMLMVAPPSYLHLTTEQRPYANFLDCFQRIRKEEGWGVFYRAWFLTFLGYCHPALR